MPAAKRHPLLFFFLVVFCYCLRAPYAAPPRRSFLQPQLLISLPCVRPFHQQEGTVRGTITPTSHFVHLSPSVPPAKGTVNGTVRGTVPSNFSFCPLCLRPFHHPLVMSVRSWRRCEKWQPPVAFAPPPRRRRKSGKGSRPAGRSSSSSCFNGATTTPVNRGGGSTEGGSRNPATAASAAAPAAAGAYPSGEASAPAAGGGATGSGPRTPHRMTISIFRNPRAAPPRGLPCSAPAEGRTAPAPLSEAAAVAAAASPAPAPAATVRGVGR